MIAKNNWLAFCFILFMIKSLTSQGWNKFFSAASTCFCYCLIYCLKMVLAAQNEMKDLNFTPPKIVNLHNFIIFRLLENLTLLYNLKYCCCPACTIQMLRYASNKNLYATLLSEVYLSEFHMYIYILLYLYWYKNISIHEFYFCLISVFTNISVSMMVTMI